MLLAVSVTIIENNERVLTIFGKSVAVCAVTVIRHSFAGPFSNTLAAVRIYISTDIVAPVVRLLEGNLTAF